MIIQDVLVEGNIIRRIGWKNKDYTLKVMNDCFENIHGDNYIEDMNEFGLSPQDLSANDWVVIKGWSPEPNENVKIINGRNYYRVGPL